MKLIQNENFFTWKWNIGTDKEVELDHIKILHLTALFIFNIPFHAHPTDMTKRYPAIFKIDCNENFTNISYAQSLLSLENKIYPFN